MQMSCKGMFIILTSGGVGSVPAFLILAMQFRVRICKHLRSPGIDFVSKCSLTGRYEKLCCRTDPPGCKGWWNRFLGPLNVYKFGLRIHCILYCNLQLLLVFLLIFLFLYFNFNGTVFSLCHLHCKEPIPKIGNKYSQKRNSGTTVSISTFMCLWAIYIFPRSICLFCRRKYVGRSWEYINRSQKH